MLCFVLVKLAAAACFCSFASRLTPSYLDAFLACVLLLSAVVATPANMPVVAGPPQGHGPSTFDKSELLRTSLNIARPDQARAK